ncbi:MAG: hydantoinase B/oxoprolinase family protein [Hyphomicrobiaceae bacterium]|nr:hydantoinase B/oxoprolinase family protein [Hyphomicrobiaceae bacterium]
MRRNLDFDDPITLQVLWNRLIFIADQADRALGRTAFSPIVRENHDYVTVLMDTKGRALAQCTWAIPVFITSLPMAVQDYFLPAYPPEKLQPGDVLLTNDPLIGTGHLPDMVMVTPIFHRGKHIGFSGSIAHMADIGGRPYSPESTDIFEEGIRLPIVKLYKAGIRNDDVYDIVRASVRLPREVIGDIDSMVAANDVMARELVRFLDEYDLEDVEALGAAIHRRSEAQMRRAISKWPRGDYTSQMTLDGYDSPVTLKCNVQVCGDSIHIDYTGSSLQVRHAINVRKHYRVAHSVYAIKCLLDPDTPNNEGCMVPITDAAPVGSILNPRNTAAGNLRNLIGHAIPSLVFKALEAVVPDKVQGDSGGAPIWGINCQGQDADGVPYGASQMLHGGQGGRAGLDGLDTLSFPSNCKCIPTEMYELSVPVLTECKELIVDSGGPGQFRGGLGQRVTLRNISTGPMNMYLASEHVNEPCLGVVGGKAGRAGAVLKNGQQVFPKGHIPLAPGESLTVELPGGGGWGEPSKRPRELIEADLALDLVTPGQTWDHYGYRGSRP